MVQLKVKLYSNFLTLSHSFFLFYTTMSELILPTDLIPNGVLPVNWVCVFDKKRHTYYYYNKVTHQKTWYLEIVLASRMDI